MEIYNKNIQSQLKDYKNNNIQNANEYSFTEQFKLTSTNNKVVDDLKYKKLSSPSTYNVESDNSMYPFNQFDNLNQAPSGRRDNSLVIKDYHSNDTAYYAKPKKPVESFQDMKPNPNAMAGSNQFLNNRDNQLDRFGQGLRYRNNDQLEGTNIRPEYIDGEIQVAGVVRAMPRDQEEVRGLGVNSQRLQSEGLNNQTGMIGEGFSTNPENINITKFPQKKYRDQTTADLIRTTGAFMKNSDRSAVHFTNTQRSTSTDYVAPPKSINSYGEYRNNQPTNKTQFEEYIGDIPVANPKSVVYKPEYRNNQAAKPTIIEDYIGDIPVTNPMASIQKHTQRNNQVARPTMFEEFIGDVPVTNPMASIQKHTSRNNQAANPTQFEEFIGDVPVTNPMASVQRHTSRNNQVANPTHFEEFIGDVPVTNPMASIQRHTSRNNQPAKPTMIEEYIGDVPVTNTKAFVQRHTSRNNQPAKPTYRDIYGQTDYTGHSTNINSGIVYYNNQPARATHIENYINTDYKGTSSRPTTLTYVKNDDKTRSGVVEEVLAKDYTGIQRSIADKGVDHTFANNQVNNERIEQTMNLTKRKLVGGTGQLAAGVENVGDLNINDERGKETVLNHGGYRNNLGYKIYDSNVRGKELLQQRVNIDNTITTVLNNNPYVNNTQHVATNNKDNIIRTTLLSDREINREQDEFIKKF